MPATLQQTHPQGPVQTDRHAWFHAVATGGNIMAWGHPELLRTEAGLAALSGGLDEGRKEVAAVAAEASECREGGGFLVRDARAHLHS